MRTARISGTLLTVVLGLVLGSHATTIGAASATDRDFGYVRVFSARIANGIGKPVSELEAIAREHGSEEVVMFPLSVGPEASAERWIVRLGSKGYAYPGLTVKPRTYLNEQRQRDRQRKVSTLSVSSDGTRIVQVPTGTNARLEWTLPVSVQSPLLYSISMDNELAAVNTIRERPSPSGDQRWPEVIRMDLPQKKAAIIQIFQYLDRKPDSLPASDGRSTAELPVETMVAASQYDHDGGHAELPVGTMVATSAAGSFAEPLEEPFDSSGLQAFAAASVERDNVVFDYSWGFNREYDSGWWPHGSPAQIHLEAGAEAHVASRVWGDFQLSQQSLTTGQLKVGSGHGYLKMDFGAWLSARGYLNLGFADWTFDLPYVPQLDLRCEDAKSFHSYLLDSSASVSDPAGRITLFSIGKDIGIASIRAALEADVKLSGQMRAESISTTDGRTFTREGESLSVSLVNGTYDREASYNEDLRGSVTVTFYPTIRGEALGIEWSGSLGSFDWEVISNRRIDLNFSRSRLSFGDVPPPTSGVLYVDADAPGPAHNGSSWTTAYNYLHEALNQASIGDEIWVAQGVYKPRGYPRGELARRATFALKDVVIIKGGYAGHGKPNPYARNIQLYETILSGDIGKVGDDTDNCYHVVTGSGRDGSAMLDGFTITGGNANGPTSSDETYNGAGMLNKSGSPTVVSCTFRGNTAKWGGGMCNKWDCSPTVEDCFFRGNTATYSGGGMQNYGSGPVLTNCTFIENSADSGGGIDNNESIATLTNCAFTGNSAKQGGGIYNGESGLTLTNCLFRGNTATMRGGGVFDGERLATTPWIQTLTNCTFSGNSSGSGRGMYIDASAPVVANCVFWGNGTTESAQIKNVGGNPAISYSCIQGWTGALGGIGNIGANPKFADADGRLSAGSPCINTGRNSAVPAGVTTDLDGSPRIINGTVDLGAYEYAGGGTPSTPTPAPTPTSKPDLCDGGESYRSFSPLTVQAGRSGQMMEVYLVIRNRGTTVSPGYGLDLYASTDTHITTSDYFIDSAALNKPLDPGQTQGWHLYNIEFPVTVPRGNYYLGWIIDPDNRISETDESNNTAYKQGYQLVVY